MIFLMITGGLLLLLFIGRWLQSEYITEKMELQKDLFEQFMSARTQMTDSLISKRLIEPILNDPQGFKISGIDENYEVHDSVNTVRIITSNSAILLSDSADSDLPQQNSSGNELPGNPAIEMKIESDSADILVHGVRMFISKVRGPGGEEDIFEKFIEPGDTAMMKTIYAENLKKNNLTVTPVWVSNKKVKEIPPLFYYESHFFDHPYGVQIENINSFIYKKLTPQIIFAILLLSIITTAFIFSYRSLRSQIRLAAMKDDLISNISHELKTPVATVKVAIEAMQQMDPVEKKAKMKDYLGMASQEVNRLDMLVNKVMNSILMDNGKQVFQKEEINLKLLVEDTIRNMGAQLQQKNAIVNFNCEEEYPVITGDNFHIRGVMYNLIDNSLKYGTEAPEITLQLTRADDQIILSCSDNGPGIPETYIARVFEKFFRVPSGNQHTIKGYGLGLYYSAQVMREMGGAIDVKNNSDAGCTFTLKFPSAK